MRGLVSAIVGSTHGVDDITGLSLLGNVQRDTIRFFVVEEGARMAAYH